MKKLTALATIILSLSGYAYAENLSAENKAFIESMIKKEFPTAKYNKQDKTWRIREDAYDITTDFKQINTPQGEIAGLVIDSGGDGFYLYELKRNSNGWNIQTQSTLEDIEKFNFYLPIGMNGRVTQLGSQKFGFELVNRNGGTAGEVSSVDWIYSVNGKYKHLEGCFNHDFAFDPIVVTCDYKVREDLPETDGFYPIEISYSLLEHQIKEGRMDNIPDGWEWAGSTSGNLRKVIDAGQRTIIAKFDSTKQAYVPPVEFAEFIKVFKAYGSEEDLWHYFKR